MPGKIDPEVLSGFVAEARGYLPQVRAAVQGFGPSAVPEALEESYRFAHIIKGAAAMIGLAGLSHVAYRLEAVLEDLLAGAPPGDDAPFVLCRLLDLVEAGVESAALGEEPDPSALEEADLLRLALTGPPPEAPPLNDEWPAESPDWLAGPEPEPAPESFDAPMPDDWPAGPDLDDRNPLGELPSFLTDEPEPDSPPQPAAPAATRAHEEPADDVSAELLEIFQMEAEEHLRTISATLPELERRPNDKAALQEVRRSAHTLKGAAAMVGFRDVTRLAHRMEDALDLLYEGGGTLTPPLLRVLFASADALEDMTAGKAVDLAPLFAGYDESLGQPAAAPPPQAEAEAAPEPAEEEPEEADRAAPRRARVNESLDELVRVVTEQVIARSAFEQRMADFLRLLSELRPSTERLRKASYKLETQYEAWALGDASRQKTGFPDRLLRSMQPYGFDDLEFDRYNEFHLLSRDLAETTSDVQTIAGELGHLFGDFESYLEQQSRLTTALEDKLMRLRMVPLSSLATQLHRTVRQVAQQRDKKAVLVLEGENTGLDKAVLEQISEPLLHLLRNAVDHGIETPEVRQARGKKPHGEIRFRAAHEGSQVVLRLTDDGGGLDAEAIRATAVRRGLATADEAAELSDRDVFGFIFRPGFSTAAAVSEISGRGVGMDVVATRVSQLKGSIGIESWPGLGTTFTIRLPLTLAISRALMVRCNQETFAVPLADVRQILRVEEGQIEKVGPNALLRLGGQTYPVVSLAQALRLRSAGDEAVTRPPVLILSAGDRDVALVVDQLLGAREIVAKNLGGHLKRVHGVSGATLMGDGRVVLIVNPAELAHERAAARPAAVAPRRAAAREDLTVLVVDDSPSVRRVVSNQLKHAGWKAVQAKNGLEALEVLQHGSCKPDLILLDVEMPRMDGYEFLGAIRASEAHRDLPVVMLTSRSGEKHRRKAFDLGVTDYLVKPYEDEVLLDRIRQLTAGRKALA